MSEEAPTQPPVPPSAPAASEPAISESTAKPALEEPTITNGAIVNGDGEQVATDAPAPVEEPASTTSTTADSIDNKQTAADDVTQEKPSAAQEYIEMKDATPTADDVPAQVDSAESAEPAEPATETPASSAKSKAPRRKSGVPEHKGKKLNKKASTARMTHIDAKPGDYFYVRLKGYPLWPAIVCDESMLPNTLIKTRPVTAAREDGTYRADYEDGGPKAKDRTFPVMYLHTNEFGWIPNYNLVDLNFDDVGTVTSNMKKDLASARQLAAEQHDLDYFKDILKQFIEAKEAEREAKEAAKAEKKAKKAAASKKEKKSAKTVAGEDGDEDVEMADAVDGPESDDAEAEPEAVKQPKKRKAEDTPQRTESIKKPRQTIKLTTTPKTTNGTATPKSTKEAVPKSAKSAKPKKAAKAAQTPEVVAPKEPELTAEEKRAKKEKEILFLRHKLQKGLLTRDQDPKEEDMKSMSEFVTKLEGYADLEVSIIRTTKINKVLKAILKLTTIPKEEEYKFKPRSQSLLDKWNKLLASEQEPSTTAATTNGTSGIKASSEEAKPSPADEAATNGTKESSAEEKTEEKLVEEPVKEEPTAISASEVKDAPAELGNVPAPTTEESARESVPEPTATAVESSA